MRQELSARKLARENLVIDMGRVAPPPPHTRTPDGDLEPSETMRPRVQLKSDSKKWLNATRANKHTQTLAAHLKTGRGSGSLPPSRVFTLLHFQYSSSGTRESLSRGDWTKWKRANPREVAPMPASDDEQKKETTAQVFL